MSTDDSTAGDVRTPGGEPLPPATDFIRAMINADLQQGTAGRVMGRVVTRFPPEPNGYPHIGHAKSMGLNFGLAKQYGGRCHLRFDDTNPETERMEFVQAIQDDLRWLGHDWGDRLYFASDYFEQFYNWAEMLVVNGDAYVCFLSEEEFRECRGTVAGPGKHSPYRDTSPDENLALLRRMKAGEFDEGQCVLRAKVDMASPNMKMRDPPMYRVKKSSHYRRGTDWCIYPMYDYAHCLGDAIEGITHSLCTLEFENNRELYDWYVTKVGFTLPPQQTEFARLSLEHVVVSKRYLRKLVETGAVEGWDDPRMPTLRGLRRRGVPKEAIHALIERVGMARTNSMVELELLDHCIRDVLNHMAPRRLGVVDPLAVRFTNWGDDETDSFELADYPSDVGKPGSRSVAFSGRVWIDRSDFAVDPPKGFKRLVPGGEVRLKGAFVVRCDEVVTDDAGEVVELVCSVDRDSRGGRTADGRKVKGTIQWVDQKTGLPAVFRLVDRLFSSPIPGADGGDLLDDVNPKALVLAQGFVEASVAAEAGRDGDPGRYQLERVGYFAHDPDSTPEALVLNRVVALRDSWKKKAPKVEKRTEPKVQQKPVVVELSPEVEAERDRLVAAWGVSKAVGLTLAQNPDLVAFVEAGAAHAGAGEVAKWAVNELPGGDPSAWPFDGAVLGGLVKRVADRKVSRAGAKKVLGFLLDGDTNVDAIIAREGLALSQDTGLVDGIIAEVLAAHPGELARFKAGEGKLMGFFIGQVMRRSKGKADGKAVKQAVVKALRG